MIPGTQDNILGLTKYIEEQKLQYVLAVWSPEEREDKLDSVSVFTNFERGELKKISEVLKVATVVEDKPKVIHETKH